MNKKSLFCVLLLLTVFSTCAMANFSSYCWCQPPSCPCEEGAIYTSRTSPDALDILEHGKFYIWKIGNLTIDPGYEITSAGLLFDNINNWQEPDNDFLYIRLLSKDQISAAKTGLHMNTYMTTASGNSTVYGRSDYLPNADDLAAYGELLATYSDHNGRWMTEDFTVSPFSASAIDLLNDSIASTGVIGIGLDSDCRYDFNSDSKIKFWYCTAATPTIPAPGAVLLGGIGVTLVGWMRGKRMF